MDTSRFEYERYRERLGESFHLEKFCRIEHFDEIYLGYLITHSNRKRKVSVLVRSIIKKLHMIYESLNYHIKQHSFRVIL